MSIEQPERTETDPNSMPKQLFVGGCHPDSTKGTSQFLNIELLEEYFSKFGKITECRLIKDKSKKGKKKGSTSSGVFRGFAFVSFECHEDAKKVIVNGPHSILDKQMQLKFA